MITNSTWSKRRNRSEINENEPIMETNRQLVQFRIRRRRWIRSNEDWFTHKPQSEEDLRTTLSIVLNSNSRTIRRYF